MTYLNRILLLALLGLACLQAQDITKGSIVGVVRDASGAVVPGAMVKLASPYGDRETDYQQLRVSTPFRVSSPELATA